MKSITNIEAEFDAVVKQLGGVPVRDLLDSKSPSFKNADYLFPTENVIAELKILEKDPHENDALQQKIQAKFDEWMAEGRLLVYGTVKIESKTLSTDMQWELMKIYSEPVRRVIKTANQQIKETKDHFNRPAAQGLVIIVNEANRELQPEHLGFAAHQSLNSNFSSVTGISLITVNMGTQMPGFPSELRLWMDYVRNDSAEIDPIFMRRFRSTWTNHYASLIGEAVPQFAHKMTKVSSMKYI